MSTHSQGFAIARRRIAAEKEAGTGKLDLGCHGLEALPAELGKLEQLEVLNLGNSMSELDPGMADTEDSRASRLGSNTLTGDLTALRNLPRLRALSLAGCWELRDLNALAGLSSLQVLFFYLTQVSEQLDCTSTPVSELSPLAGLGAMQILRCDRTSITDLGPLADLSSLEFLDCAETGVSNLKPLAKLLSLHTLVCHETSVKDLRPLLKLHSLRELNCYKVQVRSFPLRILNLPSLTRFIFSSPNCTKVPEDLFSKAYGDNCLQRLRAHF